LFESHKDSKGSLAADAVCPVVELNPPVNTRNNAQLAFTPCLGVPPSKLVRESAEGQKMAEPTDLENLQKLRAAMVEQRRYLVQDSIYMCDVNKMNLKDTTRCPEIVALQNVIEGLDRAIADEKILAKPRATVTELNI
jgi:hypothetical protein